MGFLDRLMGKEDKLAAPPPPSASTSLLPPPPRSTPAPAKSRESFETRPAWMVDGATVTGLTGSEPLEIVGESHRQDALWAIVGGWREERVSEPAVVILVPQDNNPYDPNAIGVWVGGHLCGYVARDVAAQIRPGLLRLQQEHGTAIGLEGTISGGGMRDDGRGRLGVFADYDPSDFGLAPRRASYKPSAKPRTGLSDAIAADEADDDYDLSWLPGLSADNLQAVKQLRKFLEDERDPVDRHYMHAELERRLYKARDAFASALDEYDEACRAHDDDMDMIRPQLVDKLGGVPLLETYKQACIRHSKAKNWSEALWWAERGIAIYGDQAINSEWPADLLARSSKCQQKLL